MAVQPSVTPVQPTATSAASSRMGGMGGRLSSGDQIDGMSGSPFVNLADQWRTGNDPGLGQQQNANQWLRGSGTPILFTPLVSLAAATYPAGSSFQEETTTQSALLPTDLQHGVGVYEYYMKITSGSLGGQGKVVNRFS